MFKRLLARTLYVTPLAILVGIGAFYLVIHPDGLFFRLPEIPAEKWFLAWSVIDGMVALFFIFNLLFWERLSRRNGEALHFWEAFASAHILNVLQTLGGILALGLYLSLHPSYVKDYVEACLALAETLREQTIKLSGETAFQNQVADLKNTHLNDILASILGMRLLFPAIPILLVAMLLRRREMNTFVKQ